MRIFTSLTEWLAFRDTLSSSMSLGFVPTMGNLHPGHASLLTTSVCENQATVASIFINPTQFNRRDDFTHYPRTVDDDLQVLTQCGVDYCLLPDEQQIYADDYRYQLQENRLSLLMEGEYRPGHFTGMLTVVLKLLNVVRPQTAYFGEKDYQQYLLIRDMAAALFLPVRIKPCPTIREPSGLAYSSRNNRLSPQEKKQAEQFAAIFQQPKALADVKQELLAQGIAVEYLEEYNERRFAAVQIGTVRLIDNYPLATAQ